MRGKVRAEVATLGFLGVKIRSLERNRAIVDKLRQKSPDATIGML